MAPAKPKKKAVNTSPVPKTKEKNVGIVVEGKNVHDGRGNKFEGTTRKPNGRPAFPPPVHSVPESVAEELIKANAAREANDQDRAARKKYEAEKGKAAKVDVKDDDES